MSVKRFGLAPAAALFLAANSVGDTSADVAAAFGGRQGIEWIALSPDGQRIAYLTPGNGQGSTLYTVELGGSRQARIAATTDGREERLMGCRFVADRRLACALTVVRQVDGEPLTLSRLIALNDDGSNVRVLGERDRSDQLEIRVSSGNVIDVLPGADGTVLLAQRFVPEGRAVTRLLRTNDGIGVVRLNTATNVSEPLEPVRGDAVEFIADGRGMVRILATQRVDTELRLGRVSLDFAGTEGGALYPQPRVTDTRGATTNAGLTSDVVEYLYRRPGSRDWQTLGSYNLATGRGFRPLAIDAERNAAYVTERIDGREMLVRLSLDGSMRREQVAPFDGGSLIRVGRENRVVGVTYGADGREAVYFERGLERLEAQLRQALPNAQRVRLVGASDDESKLLVWAGGDSDPGSYHLLDRTARSLSPVLPSRPALEGIAMAAVRTVSFRAADGTMIPASLTLPPRQAERGLPAIVIPYGGPPVHGEWDWLAQYFANRGFAVLRPHFRGAAGDGDRWFQANGFQSWRTAIGDVNDAGRWLIAEGIADPARLAAFGWSYGAYAALQSGVVDPELFRAVVAVAPVTDLSLARDDWRNAANAGDFFGVGRHAIDGSPARNAARIRAPVLLFHGDLDRDVRVQQSRLMRDRLRSAGRQVELVEFPGLDHRLEDSAARAQLLRRSDEFLRRALGIG